MLRTLALLTVLTFSSTTFAADAPLPSGSEWKQASETTKRFYTVGFTEGFNTGIGTYQMEQAGRAVGEATRDGKPVQAEVQIKIYPYKEEAVLKRMELIYSDPRNANLLWNEVGELALRMLDGQDINWRLQVQRKLRDQQRH